ncbi:hypothetical protein TcasGA2_TC034520 [Tribolium castaneum]|uniref:Uncharacterized protein n=1 Tax=Tribolium castaneum TaxID=7070 RepID=A0A139WPG6_TRICA|nr:hypothetical protein TcasGA2_TC034520 [Tribolium castaneum]
MPVGTTTNLLWKPSVLYSYSVSLLYPLIPIDSRLVFYDTMQPVGD